MRKTTLTRFGLILTVALVGAMFAVPMAAAQDPGNDPSSAQYDPPNIEEGTANSGGSGGSGDSGSEGLSASIGSLPFTGMDLLIVAGVALMLTGTGFALRRLSTPRDPTS